MHPGLLIARRVHFKEKDGKNISRPAIRIATAGVALGIAVMIISVAVVTGFRNEIVSKVTGFGSHIRISNLDSNKSYESAPISVDSGFINAIERMPEINHVQKFATKPGIIKTGDAVNGVVLKGIGRDFDRDFLSKVLIEGKLFNPGDTIANDSVLISSNIARLMSLKTGDKFVTYFFQNKIRVRKFTVSGIFRTNFQEFDDLFVVTDILHVQKLNGWDSSQISGLEMTVKDFDKLDNTAYEVYLRAANHFDQNGSSLMSKSIKELYPDIFGWLSLIDTNVWIILILMIIVSAFNMTSGVLILILEKAQFIGIMKAIGSRNKLIRTVFVVQSIFITSRGLFWGNLIGLGFCLMQYFWHLIPLDPVNYYVSYVPVNISIWHILVLNVGTLSVITLMMVLPSLLISAISPAKAIKFE